MMKQMVLLAEPAMGEELALAAFQRFKQGETLRFMVPETGFLFDVRPEYSQKLQGVVLGFTTLVNGKPHGHYRSLFEREEMLQWFASLVEVKMARQSQ